MIYEPSFIYSLIGIPKFASVRMIYTEPELVICIYGYEFGDSFDQIMMFRVKSYKLLELIIIIVHLITGKINRHVKTWHCEALDNFKIK